MSVIKKLTRQAMNGREKIQMWQEVSAYDDDDQYSQFVGGLSHVEVFLLLKKFPLHTSVPRLCLC